MPLKTCLIAMIAASLVGCGGGSTTTIIEEAPAEARKATTIYLPSPAIEKQYVRPKLYSFSVDGSLVGKSLTWSGWGSSTATGTGTIEERNWSSDQFNDRPDYRGAVVASGLEECKGKAYYTEVVAKVPPNAVYVPEKATQLATPCRSFESIQEEASAANEAEERPQLVRCGNPPNWSGTLVASGVTCGEADLVFTRIHCRDEACTERRSQGWVCETSQSESEYQYVGRCRDGDRFIRWRVNE